MTFRQASEHNKGMSCMKPLLPLCLGGVALLALILTTVASGDAAPPERTTLYWCPDQLGSERIRIQFNPEPGCQTVIDEKEKEEVRKEEDKTRPKWVFTIDTIEDSVSAFMQRYRHFLACCTSDSNAIEEINDLEEEASALVEFLATSLDQRLTLFFYTHGGLIAPELVARDQLRKLKIRLESLVQSRDSLDTLSYESAGHERRRIRKVEESILRDFAPPPQFERAPTGPEIGTPGTLVDAIGQSAPTGPEIGTPGTPADAIGQSAPTGPEIGTPGTPADAIGQSAPTSTITGIAHPTVFYIGTTPNTGPAFGDSSFNQRP